MAILRIIACSALLLLFSRPASAEFVSSKVFSYPGYAKGEGQDVVVSNNKAYLAMGNGGLCIVDISNPAQPAVLGRLDLPGTTPRLKVNGDLVFLASWTNGLHIVNAANPASPVLLTTIEAGQTVTDSALFGASLYIAEGNSGVVIFGISDPASPNRLRVIDTPGFAYEVVAYSFAGGNFIAIADGTNGLIGYNVSNPSNPTQYFHDGPQVVRSVAHGQGVETNERLLYFPTSNYFWASSPYPYVGRQGRRFPSDSNSRRVFAGNGLCFAASARNPAPQPLPFPLSSCLI